MATEAAGPGRKRASAGHREGQPKAPRRRIAIACQGGGSPSALRGLFDAGVHNDFQIVSLSGTSGGAICATLAWYALMKGDPEPWQRLYAFWRENAARSPE